MDWKSLTAKLNPLTAKLNPFLEKAKDVGFKALDFTQKQLQNTPIVLKTLEEYTLLRESKRFILIAYDESDPLAREVLLRSPVWSTQAWSDAAEIRFIEISSAPDIVRNLNITTPLDMRVWYSGTETFHGSDVEALKHWWKTRCYDGTDTETKFPSEEDQWKISSKVVSLIENTENSDQENVPQTMTSSLSPTVDALAEK